MLKSINPYADSLLGEFEEHDDRAVETRIQKAVTLFDDWRRQPFQARAGRMKQAANVLRDNKDKYARIIATEMGKVVKEAIAEVDKCADACDFYADHAEAFLKDLIIPTEDRKSVV